MIMNSNDKLKSEAGTALKNINRKNAGFTVGLDC